MGKQSKRKNKRRSGGGGQHHRPTGLVDAPAIGGVGTVEDASPVAKIIKKIRHGDPRVRHAALVALSSTLFDSTSLSAAAKKKREGVNNIGHRAATGAAAEVNNPVLLRALSEKILDVDIPCATTAVGCLSNYVSFYFGQSNSATEDSDEEELEVASEVLVPILLRRIQTSLGTIQAMGSQLMTTASSKEADKKDSKQKKGKPAKSTNAGSNTASGFDKHWSLLKDQWSLLSLSLLTLAGLIENCPKAVRRLGANAFPQLLSALPLASDSLQLLSATSGNASRNEGIEKVHEVESILDAATYASRALHSLLDDNAALINSLPLALGTAASVSSAVTVLTNTINNMSFSDMTRLHAAGSILSLRRVLILEKENPTDTNRDDQLVVALQTCTNNVIIPMLRMILDFNEDDHAETSAKHLLSQMMALSLKLSSIKQDEQMENQIEKEVNARKEPAREIARRQKKIKEEKKKEPKKMKDTMDVEVMKEDMKELKNMEGIEDVDAPMIVEGDKEDGKNSARNEAEEGDLQQQLDHVVQSWKNLVGSHKLALELVANLCSDRQDEGEDGDMGGGMTHGDDDEHMWDSDDEAQLMEATAAAKPFGGASTAMSPFEHATYDSMASNCLPEQILGFFRKWVNFLPAYTMGKLEDTVPALVSGETEDVLSTCALCLGNVVSATQLSTWSAPATTATTTHQKSKNGLESFWMELISILASCSSSNNCNVNYEFKYHVTSVMLSLFRSQPESLTLVDLPTLNGFLTLLMEEQQQSPKQGENTVQMHCHVISMLGLMCSSGDPQQQQPPSHSSIDAAHVGTMVCRALLQRLRLASEDNSSNHVINVTKNSVIIIHTILNVLMDIYGDDDERKDEVFRSEDVSGHFERCLPGYKRRVKKVARTTAMGSGGGDLGVSFSQGEVGVWNETALNASRFIKYKRE